MAVYIGYSYTLFFLLFVCLLLKNSRRAWARLEKILSGVQAPSFECVLPCLVSSACSSQVHQLGWYFLGCFFWGFFFGWWADAGISLACGNLKELICILVAWQLGYSATEAPSCCKHRKTTHLQYSCHFQWEDTRSNGESFIKIAISPVCSLMTVGN